MLQATMVKPGEIVFNEIPRPEPKKDEILVKMQRIGVCGSDIHVYKGMHPYTDYPIVQGHEASGIIEGSGSEVKDLKKGDNIILAAFGGGFTWGSVYLRWAYDKK
jgi:D-arabinose 1-dehydrogenase-like Zn-dependent alcohol dehydrogenase